MDLGLPTSTDGPVTATEEGNEVARLEVDTTLYTSDALFRACYTFTDRCYLFLKQQTAHAIVVEFRKSDPSVSLADVVGAFANELINQRVRAAIASETRAIRERIVAQAFAEADFRAPAP
jgi:His-Xaa-Ser system protein HxsD